MNHCLTEPVICQSRYQVPDLPTSRDPLRPEIMTLNLQRRQSEVLITIISKERLNEVENATACTISWMQTIVSIIFIFYLLLGNRIVKIVGEKNLTPVF